MIRRFFGVLSLLLIFIALGLAIYRLLSVSPVLGACYMVIVPIAFLLVLYAYCRKCPHAKEGTCRHVLFGWLVTCLFKTHEPSSYTLRELLLTLFSLIILILLPQYWLFGTLELFIAFWALMAAAIVMVLASVCRGCFNRNCAFCPNKK